MGTVPVWPRTIGNSGLLPLIVLFDQVWGIVMLRFVIPGGKG